MEWYPDEDEEDLMFSPALLARRASESWIVEPPVEVNIYFFLFVFRSKLIKGYDLNLIYWLEFPSLQNHRKKIFVSFGWSLLLFWLVTAIWTLYQTLKLINWTIYKTCITKYIPYPCYWTRWTTYILLLSLVFFTRPNLSSKKFERERLLPPTFDHIWQVSLGC